MSTDTATDDSRSPDMGKDTATADKAKKSKKPTSEKKAAKMREAKIAEELRNLKKVRPENAHELRETSEEPEMDESPSAERISKRKLPRESSVEVDPETGEILVDYDSDKINPDDSREMHQDESQEPGADDSRDQQDTSGDRARRDQRPAADTENSGPPPEGAHMVFYCIDKIWGSVAYHGCSGDVFPYCCCLTGCGPCSGGSVVCRLAARYSECLRNIRK